VEICARVYRSRQARESPLFRLVEQHLEEFLRVYPERFAKQHGPLRPVVERVLRTDLVRPGRDKGELFWSEQVRDRLSGLGVQVVLGDPRDRTMAGRAPGRRARRDRGTQGERDNRANSRRRHRRTPAPRWLPTSSLMLYPAAGSSCQRF
jgi:hypothetical protein